MRRILGRLMVVVLGGALVAAQPDEPIKGAAALRYPAVQAAIKSAELIRAGKLDDAFALRTKDAQTELKAMSATERREWHEATAKMTPDPVAFADAVRKTGELSIFGNSGVLGATMPKGRASAWFEREGDTWRITNGPLAFTEP